MKHGKHVFVYRAGHETASVFQAGFMSPTSNRMAAAYEQPVLETKQLANVTLRYNLWNFTCPGLLLIPAMNSIG